MMEKNPLRNIRIPGVNDDRYSIEDYVASIKKNYPSLAVVWCDVMDEDLLHAVRKSPEGQIVDRMSDTIGQALDATLNSYQPEDPKIQAPVLSIYAINDGDYYLSP